MGIFLTIIGIIFALLIVLSLGLNYKSIATFAKASYKEMHRVTFPTWERAISQTYVVLASVTFFAILFGLIDVLLVRGMGFLFR
jgi:preprotein translocase SecE subunit